MGNVSTFAGIAALSLFAGTFLECALEWMNCRHLRRNAASVPPEFEGRIGRGALWRSCEYSIDKAKFSALCSLYAALLWTLFIFSGMMGVWVQAIAGLGLGLPLSGLLLFGSMLLAKYILFIPLELHSTFVLEKSYGFCSTTPRLWIIDQLKMLLIGGVLFIAVCRVSLLIIQSLPGIWWLPLWAFLLLVAIFASWLAPSLIAPLFNKYEPVGDPELEGELRSLMARAGLKLQAVLRMDASKRTRHTNAFFTGLGSTKRIVFFDTLLEKLDKEEILAVAAHEAGHWRLRHIPKLLAMSQVATLACAVGVFLLTRDGFLPRQFHIPETTPEMDKAAALALCVFLAEAFSWPLAPLALALSRRFEREADKFAAELCDGGSALASTLVKLSKDNLSNLIPHPLYVFFNYSHPTALERIRTLRPLKPRDTGETLTPPSQS